MYNEDGLGVDVSDHCRDPRRRAVQSLSGHRGPDRHERIDGGHWHGYRVDPQFIYAGYIKGIYPLILGRPVCALGSGGAQWHRNYDSDSSNDAGLSFGVGLQFNVAGNTALTLEWARLTSGDNVGYHYDADTFTFGVDWRF